MADSESGPLTEDEMVLILEAIARNPSNAAARIAAIKQLREMADGEQDAAGVFAVLDELAPRRNYRLKG